MERRSTREYFQKLSTARCVEDHMWLSTGLLAVNETLRYSARADRVKRQWLDACSLPQNLLYHTASGDSLVFHHGLLVSVHGAGRVGSHEWDRVTSAVMWESMVQGGSGWVVTYFVA